jgi:predicted Zn-dependent protease
MATKKTAPISKKIDQASDDRGALKNYESALRSMHDKKYDRAKTAFEDLLASEPPQHIADRVRVHLNLCRSKLSDSAHAPKTASEQYDYAVVLMNENRFDEARAVLDRLSRSHPDADFAHYGLAVLSCVSGRAEEALRHLQRSIEMNPQNRIQARNDSDFQTMADDPRFTELLYPEALGEVASPHWRS